MKRRRPALVYAKEMVYSPNVAFNGTGQLVRLSFVLRHEKKQPCERLL